MKLTIIGYFLGSLAGLLLNGCGSLKSEQSLTVQMYGISKAPANATGTRDPKFQIYQLLQVQLLGADGVTPTSLFDNDVETKLRIVDREQIVYSKKIDDLVGNAYSAIQLSFAPAVTGGETAEQELGFTLSNATASLSQNFTVEKAKSLTLLIKLEWGNTIADGAMSEPGFELSLD